MTTSMSKTYSARETDVSPAWYLVDASHYTLGRLASQIALRLQGKRNPLYTPGRDMGDYIVVIHADKIKITGNKLKNKKYFRHTGYPGGIKSVLLGTLIKQHPERVLEQAVKRMLPKGPLGYKIYKKLKVYAGENHPHEAQKLQALVFTKNVKQEQVTDV